MSDRKNVLSTTSREPPNRIRTLCNDIGHVLPNVIRVNRGKLSLDGVAEKGLEIQADRIIVIDRGKAGFANIRFFRIGSSGLTPVPPLLSVVDVRLQREFNVKSRHIESTAITMLPKNSLTTERLARFMGKFFDIPILSSECEVSGFSAVMRISNDASGRVQITFVTMPELLEVGPRIDVSKVVWEL